METILHTITYWITNQNLKEMQIYAPRITTIKTDKGTAVAHICNPNPERPEARGSPQIQVNLSY